MHRDSAHKPQVEVGNKIRVEDNEVLVVVHDHEHNGGHLVEADIGRA